MKWKMTRSIKKGDFFTSQKAKIWNSFLEAISLFLELGKHPTNVFTRTSPSSPPPLVNIWILTNTAKKCCFSKELGLPWTTKFKVGILLRMQVQSDWHILIKYLYWQFWAPKGEKNLWRYPKKGRRKGGDYQIKVGRGVSRCKAGLSRGSKAHTVYHLLLGISFRLRFCFWVVSRTVFTRMTITMS